METPPINIYFKILTSKVSYSLTIFLNDYSLDLRALDKLLHLIENKILQYDFFFVYKKKYLISAT